MADVRRNVVSAIGDREVVEKCVRDVLSVGMILETKVSPLHRWCEGGQKSKRRCLMGGLADAE